MSVVIDAAKHFADSGYYVFPSFDKLPIIEQWPEKATRDKEIISNWFTDQKTRFANGFSVCPKNSCVVIDVDIKDGKNGSASLQRLITEYGMSKDTQVIMTKSGGLHLYYAYPDLSEDQYIKSITNWVVDGVELDGIDIRGNKGQVVGPCDNGYKSINHVNVADLQSLPDALISNLPIGTVHKAKSKHNDASALITDSDRPLKGVIPEIIYKGDRHQTLVSLTASWARKVPYDTAKVLLKEAIRRCEGSDIAYEDYVSRLDDAYDKFEPVVEDRLQWMLDNLIYVVGQDSVYRLDKPGNLALVSMQVAVNYFKAWKIFEETEDGKLKSYSCFSRWLSHLDRQTVEHVGYKPVDDMFYVCEALGETVINTYRAPNIPPVDPTTPRSTKWFKDLVKFLWQEESELILDYCAHLMQRPEKKIHWCPLLITEQEGMGKNLFFEVLSECMGKWNAAIINAALLSKTFNTFLVNNRLILINEVQDVSKKDRQAVMSKLKSCITEKDQQIEGKGTNSYLAEIFCSFFIFSNKINAIDIEKGTRRIHVYINRLAPKQQLWYLNIVKQAAEGGIAEVADMLMTRDISNFRSTGHAPLTDSKVEAVQSNLSEYQLEIMQHIEFRYSIFNSDIVTDDSWQYYINNVLHKGIKMSVSQEKYIKSQLFQRVRTPAGTSRQIRLGDISRGSDETILLRGKKNIKSLVFTTRNHGSYDTSSTDNCRREYEKIFKASALELNIV